MSIAGPEYAHLVDDELASITLAVPAQPTVRDLAIAFRSQLSQEIENAEGAVLGLELDVANAQRIAWAAREKVVRLRSQLETLDAQINSLQ